VAIKTAEKCAWAGRRRRHGHRLQQRGPHGNRVRLRCKTLRERTRLLIGIAHPDFHTELIEEWERRFRMT